MNHADRDVCNLCNRCRTQCGNNWEWHNTQGTTTTGNGANAKPRDGVRCHEMAVWCVCSVPRQRHQAKLSSVQCRAMHRTGPAPLHSNSTMQRKELSNGKAPSLQPSSQLLRKAYSLSLGLTTGGGANAPDDTDADLNSEGERGKTLPSKTCCRTEAARSIFGQRQRHIPCIISNDRHQTNSEMHDLSLIEPTKCGALPTCSSFTPANREHTVARTSTSNGIVDIKTQLGERMGNMETGQKHPSRQRSSSQHHRRHVSRNRGSDFERFPSCPPMRTHLLFVHT